MLNDVVTYWYEGICPQTRALLRLPRTTEVEAIAFRLMQDLATDERYSCEGKMYGVLLVETPSGEKKILKAFSGLLNGHSIVEDWVPPIPGREQVALEAGRTLSILDEIKQELLTLQTLPERQQYETLNQEYVTRLQKLILLHQQRKQERHQQRQNHPTDSKIFDQQSQLDGIERKKLKHERDNALKPLQEVITQADTRIHELKQQRKILSRRLQTQMYSAYSLTNFLGQTKSLEELMSQGFLPTGTGDCCAPKLLHYAATQRLKPLTMAEFWWGESNLDKIQGEFYGACVERCQPLMGFLLSGLPNSNLHHSINRKETLKKEIEVKIIYEDEWLIAVEKPSGLLSVPGRYRDNQDSVLNRLKQGFPELIAVHRLDLDTSGILLLARNMLIYRQLSKLFQERKIYKVYEALLVGSVKENEGVIELPLWGNPEHRPYQIVDFEKGKISVTHFKVMSRDEQYTRIEFYPLTGRTHQIRVHSADAKGLGCPILGDRLYGDSTTSSRLHLYARELKFEHPQTHQILHLKSQTPFKILIRVT
ncbi:RluA family pseudouridine synthase [Chroococcus sp. FPU101]|uniref:RluA family pseudouridine synthase n=1 Tax=Chroococcus sp. FPU101 TaxID=1974212 RepID=UPI001A8CF49A|nr:RluA family pseudouridine synthase [Chroococcus sp. FPU101]GFE69721.1 pseudouridine synthase [Chroococcus sp. FPU101]